MSWKEPSERHSDDLIAAIDRAARTVSHALTDGFALVAKQIITAVPGTPDNSAEIETTVKNIKTLIDNLHQSLPKVKA
jgi:hypothetical protein